MKMAMTNTDIQEETIPVCPKEYTMPAYEDDDRFEPIAPIQPVNRIRAVRAIRQMRPRPYFGERKARLVPTISPVHEDPAAILDISPQAREEAHHHAEEAPNEETND